MKINTKKLIKISLCAIAGMGLGLTTSAQNVQEGSVWAPDKAKVDGKLDEWGNTLQANNKTTNIWYTIANDDKHLILAIKSTDQSNTAKILGGGINFTINTEGKKKDKDAFVITFPIVNREGMRNSFRRAPGAAGGAPQMPDSAAMANMRKQMLANMKEIKIKGFKEIPDSVISIYNEYGIKAAVNYDANGSFIYELSIPFEQLGISLDKTKEIAYNVKVNGIQMGRRDGERDGGGDGGNRGGGDGGNRGGGGGNFGGGGGGNFGGGGGGRAVVVGGFGGGGRMMGGMGGMNFQDMLNPTDFWGKYVLAKK